MKINLEFMILSDSAHSKGKLGVPSRSAHSKDGANISTILANAWSTYLHLQYWYDSGSNTKTTCNLEYPVATILLGRYGIMLIVDGNWASAFTSKNKLSKRLLADIVKLYFYKFKIKQRICSYIRYSHML